jgi:hypothetical protein
MEQLCRMAYFREDLCEELTIAEPGSFDPVWRKYDAFEPKIVPELKVLYITEEFTCLGSSSFIEAIFPNCHVIIMR